MHSSVGQLSAKRLVIEDQPDEGSPASNDFAADIRAGLTQAQKQLFPKYFYDEIGSRLFDCICLLPEYYLTRAEDEILRRHADEIVQTAKSIRGADLTLIELGSGSAQKTRLIIEALLRRQRELLYTPVDISVTALETSARLLLESYAPLRVAAYAGDYFKALERMVSLPENKQSKLVLFLGSNIGNFDRQEALAFLHALRRTMKAGDALLLGADLKKPRAVLEAAYDDPLGITAAFNLNLLARINRELDADFNLRQFKHHALYQESEGRVEMYLESCDEQDVNIRQLDLRIHFANGERIHTENSHKYDLEQLAQLAAQTGFDCVRTWFDSGRQFSSNLFVATAQSESA